MARNVDDLIDKLSPARRNRVEARAAILIAEEMTLQELRQARKLTQVRMAKNLGIAQKQISEIEKRTDMHISTLRRAVEAMGGSLSLVAQFPDREPVALAGIATLGAASRHPSRDRRRAHAVRSSKSGKVTATSAAKSLKRRNPPVAVTGKSRTARSA